MSLTSSKVDRSIVRKALGDGLPLFIPGIPFALVMGLAITESGINSLIGWSSSPIIFGGAAQLTLISLLGTGTAVAASVVAALVVNARHLMYSAAMVPIFQRQPRWFRWVGPYFLLDQVFALSILRSDDEPRAFRTYYLSVGIFFLAGWIFFTGLGLVVGPVIPEAWNLGFAVPVMFLGLVVMSIDRYPKAVAAFVGAGTTYVFAALPNRSSLLVGALVGIIAGVIAERVNQ